MLQPKIESSVDAKISEATKGISGGSASFAVVNLGAGQSVTLSEGAEVVLRSGACAVTGTMADWESRLAPYHFVRCNTYLLVNLGYVTRIYGDEVTVGGKILRVSRSKKQQLMNEFAKYMGGSK